MSSTEHGPLGSGSAVAVGLLPALLPAVGLSVAVGLLLSVGAVPTGAGVGTAEVLAEVGEDETSAPTGRADGPLPPPPPPMKWATPNTSANTTATSASRLVQYTRDGSGPRGRVTALMTATVTSRVGLIR
jgi:hypothetical protein